MTWVEIGQNNMLAARRMCKEHPRAAISRAYYAAHVVLADALSGQGYAPVPPYETQPHKQQSQLISQHLVNLTGQESQELVQAVSRLYKRRLDSDYSKVASVTKVDAKDALRDSSIIFRLLKVEE